MLHYELEKLTHAQMETMTYAELEEHFIINRTTSDVALANRKGVLDVSTATRIEQALKLICEYLGITYNSVEWLDDRNRVPNNSDFYQKIYDKMVEIEAKTPLPTVQIPSMPHNTYQKWNDIETFLKVIYDNIVAKTNNYSYLGEGYFGED